MRLPKMIGAHVPRKPARRTCRCRLNETARMINHAYDEKFVASSFRTHLVYRPTPLKP